MPKVSINVSDVVLIDDDVLVQMTWKIAAKRAGVTLRVFTAPSEFWLAIDQIGFDASIFVDLHLGGQSGEEVIHELYRRGYRDLWMASGDDSGFLGLPIRGVVGKTPPF